MGSKSTMTTQANGDQVEFGTITFEGHESTALGSVVSADGQYASGYYKGEEAPKRYAMSSGMITTWDGKTLGVANVVGKWRTPRSYLSSHMLQVTALINGIWYTGRTGGSGMLWRGKRIAKQ